MRYEYQLPLALKETTEENDVRATTRQGVITTAQIPVFHVQSCRHWKGSTGKREPRTPSLSRNNITKTISHYLNKKGDSAGEGGGLARNSV